MAPLYVVFQEESGRLGLSRHPHGGHRTKSRDHRAYCTFLSSVRLSPGGKHTSLYNPPWPSRLRWWSPHPFLVHRNRSHWGGGRLLLLLTGNRRNTPSPCHTS